MKKNKPLAEYIKEFDEEFVIKNGKFKGFVGVILVGELLAWNCTEIKAFITKMYKELKVK